MTPNDSLEFFASCMAGLEPFAADELRRLGMGRVRPLSGGVAFFGTFEQGLRACLWSRFASRITWVLARVDASDADALYQGVRSIPWNQILRDGASFAVQARGTNDELRNTSFTALLIKDAVVDQMRADGPAAARIDLDDPDVLIIAAVHADRATVSVNLTGETLYARSYLDERGLRHAAHEVPYALAVLGAAGWPEAVCAQGADAACLVDPLAGEGLVACEAALMLADAAQGISRERWGFQGLAACEDAAWGQLLAEADDRFEAGLARAELMAAHACRNVEGGRAVFAAVGSQKQQATVRARLQAAGVRSLVEVVLDDAWSDAAVRAVRSMPKRASLAVASVLDANLHDAQPCVAKAEAGSFARVAIAAREGATCAAVGMDDALSGAYPEGPAQSFSVGKGRIEAHVSAFSGARAAFEPVMVPDPADGREHAVCAADRNAGQFAARLRKNLRERRKWASRSGVSCYRLYDADLPDFSVAIDVYEGDHEGKPATCLTIAEYAPPRSVDPAKAAARFNDVLRLAPAVCGVAPSLAFAKVRRRDKGGSQYAASARQAFPLTVEEQRLRFEVDLTSYVDTGLFLDHRETRARLRRLCQGKRFLNLFAYTGAATVYAAAGGASETTTVDLSQTYLDWAQRNMALNGFTGPNHWFERADVMPWITHARREGLRFDVVFVDPPTFSNSKSMGRRTWDVQRDHVELLIGVSRLLAKGGVAVFSCNLRSFKPDLDALAHYGVALRDVSAQTIPADFERNQRIHRCYLVQRAQQ